MPRNGRISDSLYGFADRSCNLHSFQFFWAESPEPKLHNDIGTPEEGAV